MNDKKPLKTTSTNKIERGAFMIKIKKKKSNNGIEWNNNKNSDMSDERK